MHICNSHPSVGKALVPWPISNVLGPFSSGFLCISSVQELLQWFSVCILDLEVMGVPEL